MSNIVGEVHIMLDSDTSGKAHRLKFDVLRDDAVEIKEFLTIAYLPSGEMQIKAGGEKLNLSKHDAGQVFEALTCWAHRILDSARARGD